MTSNKNRKELINRNWNLIKEESEGGKEEKDPYEECEVTINKIKNDIRKLQKQFKTIGVSNITSLDGRNIIKKLNNMHEMFCDFEPVRKKFHRDNESPQSSQSNPNNRGAVRSESDVKMDADAERDVEKKALDVSKKYDMDIQLVDEIVENVTNQLRKSRINEVQYIDGLHYNDDDPDEFYDDEETEEDLNQDFDLTDEERDVEIPKTLNNLVKQTNGKLKIVGENNSQNKSDDTAYYFCKIGNEKGRLFVKKLPISPEKYGYGRTDGKYHFQLSDFAYTMEGDLKSIISDVVGYGNYE